MWFLSVLDLVGNFVVDSNIENYVLIAMLNSFACPLFRGKSLNRGFTVYDFYY